MSISAPVVPSSGLEVKSIASAYWWTLARYLTLAIVGTFLLSTIRHGHTWGDDFAQYLNHAKNIVELRQYAETGYIYNPQNAIVGPRAYPPGFPTVLAPVFGLCGLDLNAFKVLNVLLFLTALLIVARLFSNDLCERNVWICLAILGFSPVYWEFKDIVASENLFLPLWYATLLVADDWYRRQKLIGTRSLHGIILGVLIFATCATRTVGVVLLPTIVACEMLVARKLTLVGSIALLTAVFLLGLERFIVPSSGAGYGEQLRGISFNTLTYNAYSDTTAFSLIWQNQHWEALRKVAGLIFAGIAFGGFLRANLSKLTVLGIAATGYFIVIVAWPSADGLRMIMPLVPLFVFYLLIGLNAWRSKPRLTTLSSMGLLVFSLLSFGGFYARADFGQLSSGVETAAAQELFKFVREHTQPDEVCLFFKPRALALYTARKASAFPLGVDPQDFWKYATSIGADLIIVREGVANLKTEDQTYEMLAPYASREVTEVFCNSQFTIYRRNISLAAGEIRSIDK